MPVHPRKNDDGGKVLIDSPDEASPPESWSDRGGVAIATPDCPMPKEINGVALARAAANRAAARHIYEPDLQLPKGLKAASGTVILEPDGRVWMVAPTNQFGGYTQTFPKGKLDVGLSLQANAVKEAEEEAGLQVELLSFLADSKRSTSLTRFYLARRLGGNPASMGWESQAVLLVPLRQASALLNRHEDRTLLAAIGEAWPPHRTQILIGAGIGSTHRILSTIDGYRHKYGRWPDAIQVHAGMAQGLQEHFFTPLGWAMLAMKVGIEVIDEGTVIATGADGSTYEYCDPVGTRELGAGAEQWIWGVALA